MKKEGLMENILKRRSIRKYLKKPVERARIDEILLAGMAAPSAMGTEPWKFVVILDQKLLAKVPEAH
ncbi:MAG: nitroreductase family protein, partial [Candidatus Wallbacteria bacterium]|nr:nitroreductase family protein [Candidatus Wallbacteria bacterium]